LRCASTIFAPRSLATFQFRNDRAGLPEESVPTRRSSAAERSPGKSICTHVSNVVMNDMSGSTVTGYVTPGSARNAGSGVSVMSTPDAVGVSAYATGAVRAGSCDTGSSVAPHISGAGIVPTAFPVRSTNWTSPAAVRRAVNPLSVTGNRSDTGPLGRRRRIVCCSKPVVVDRTSRSTPGAASR